MKPITFYILITLYLIFLYQPTIFASNKPDPDVLSSVTGKRPPKAYKWANKKSKQDKDADGIPDSLEKQPFIFGSLSIELNPKKKDVIIFIDSVGTDGANRPTDSAIQILLNAFNEAPVKGRGGKKNRGINLSIILSSGYPEVSDTSIGNISGGSYDWSDVDAIKQYAKASYGLQNTPEIYHYCVSCNNYAGSGSSGLSRNDVSTYDSFRKGATDFILSLQGKQSDLTYAGATAGTIMHEFGHNLGLTHGGYDHINYKPNYISIMNYHFQFSGVKYDKIAKYDYSCGRTRPLDERKIKEKKGLGKKAANYYTKAQYPGGSVVNYNVDLVSRVNWNRNSGIDKKSYELNMNYPNDILLTWLVSEDNWKNINFTGGGVIPSAAENAVLIPKLSSPAYGEKLPSKDSATPNYSGRFMTINKENSCLEFTPEIRKELSSKKNQERLENLIKTLKPLKIKKSKSLTLYQLAD